MPCPHCGRAAGAPASPCPQCPSPAATGAASPLLLGRDHEGRTAETVIDPEVLPPESAQARQGLRQEENEDSATQGNSFRFAVWHSGFGASQGGGPGGTASGKGMDFGGVGMARHSCLPGCVTVFLLLVCAVQFGILAALGFLFFHVVGSALLLAFKIRQALQGRFINPWPGRVLVWCASWGLAGWLSGGL